ncbi:uncharacterized protein LOC123315873 isoform X2 [Coccinella septempunctata]|nr:uncharacterized protein LOC123315873 isoform X2 [Coccinella septempunctata]
MCDGLGRRFSFTCPNATLFQQRMLICDHWFMVNCSRSESDYGANLLIGQKETPFVGETGLSSFQRTPRPDYTAIKLDQTKGIFQRAPEPSEDSNLIPVNSEEQNNVPTSWSTEYLRPDPTVDPTRRQDQQTRGTEKTSSATLENRLNNGADRGNSGQEVKTATYKPIVNFQSNYKATTPVYPQTVDETLKMKDLDLVPPKTQPVVTRIEDINNLQSTEYRHEEDTSVPVNFESHFKATTPVYPTFVDDSLKLVNLELSPPILHSQNENVILDDKTQKLEANSPVVVNFESRFKATTPVYPKFVEDALKLNDLDLLPPSSVIGRRREEEEAKVNFVSNFKATTPVYPSSVEATSPLPDGVGLLPPLEDVPKQNQQFTETTTRRSVNFESNFEATVPNYPQSVEATSPLPDEVGLLPPSRNDVSGRFLNFQPKDDTDNQGRPEEEEQAKQPVVFYEPPLFETGYVNPNGALASYQSNYNHVISPKIDDWNALRRRFSVPDFDFPLDSEVKRASYESDRSSFQPRPAGSQVR